MMIRCSFAALLLLSCSLSTAQEDFIYDTVLAVVNGHEITQQQFDSYIKTREAQTDITPQAALDELIKRTLIVQDAERQQLDQTPDFVFRMDDLRTNMLATEGMQYYLKQHPVTETRLKAEYDKQAQTMARPLEYKVRHILLKTKAEARAILAQLKAGENFGELAQKQSQDMLSAQNQGDLDWITTRQVVEDFGNAVARLKKGELSEPVKSEFGWHIILLEDVRKQAPPPFASVKEQLELVLRNRTMQKYVDGLYKDAKIEVKVNFDAETTD